MKSFPFLIILSLSSFASAFEEENAIEFDCGLSKCKVECVGPGKHTRQFAKGSKVTLYSQSNGTTIFRVKSAHNGSRTIIASGDNYICSVIDHR